MTNKKIIEKVEEWLNQENIEKWIAKGGIGILYQANQDSLKELYNKVEKYYGE